MKSEIDFVNKEESNTIIICKNCNGRGFIPDRYNMLDDECETCNGRGRLQRVILIRDYKLR